VDQARFPLEGREWDEFWYASRLEDCHGDLERQFFQSQELVRNEVIQRMPIDQLKLLDADRLSDYCRVAVARRLEDAGHREESLALLERVLTSRLQHPMVNYETLFRRAIQACRAHADFARAIELQRDLVSFISMRDGPAAARTEALDLAQLMVEGGEESRGAFVFSEWFDQDPSSLAEANKRSIAALRPDSLAETARELQESMDEARVEGDVDTLSLYRDLINRARQTPPTP
jgi:hypothetical protein